MTWTKLSDDYSDDCWTLSDKAFRLHTEALIWSNRKLLDCVISKDDVRRFAKHPEATDELVAAGWWKDIGNAYAIQHHATYQRTKDKVIAQQAANKANRAKRGKATPPPREQAGSTNRCTTRTTKGTGQDRQGLSDSPTDEVPFDPATGEVLDDPSEADAEFDEHLDTEGGVSDEEETPDIDREAWFAQLRAVS